MVLLATLVTEYVADLTDLESGAKKAAELVKQFGNLKQPDVVAKSFTMAGQQAADMATKTASATSSMSSGLSNVAQKADSAASSEKKLGSTAEQASNSIGSSLVGALHGGVSGLIEFADHATTAVLNMGQLAQQGISLAEDLLKPAASAKEVESSLTIFDGSVAKAREEMGKLADFASQTPFDTQPIDEMALKMQGVGISSKKVVPYLTALGDAMDAMGDTSAADLEGLVDSFNKIQSTGHLTGEVIQSFADRGINVWKILEQQTGKTQSQLQKMVSDGAIPAADAMRYLTEGIEASPLYKGQMANDAQGVAGAISNLRANFNKALVSFGSPILDKLVPIFNNVGAAISDPAFQSFAGSVGTGIATVFGKIGDAASHIDFKALGKEVTDLGTWFNANLKPALDAAAPKFQALGDTVTKLAQSALPPLLSKVEELTPKVVTIAGDIAGGLSTAITTITANFNSWAPPIGIVGAILLTLFIPAIIKSGVESVIAGGKIAVQFVTNIIKSGVAGWKAARDLAIYVGQLIASGAKAVWAGTVTSAQFVGGLIKTAAQSIATGATISATVVAGFIATGAKAIWAGAVTTAQFVGSLIKTAAQAAITGATMTAQLIPSIVSFVAEAAVAVAVAIPALIAGFIAWAISAWTVAAANIAAFWPVYLVIAIIALIIGLVILAVKNWGAISAWFGGVFSALGTLVHNIINGIGAFFSWLGTKVHGIFSSMGASIGAFFSNIGTWAHDRVTSIGNFFSGLGSKVHDIFSRIGDFIGGIWNGMLNGAKTAVNSVIGVINGIIGGINNISSKIGIPAIPSIPYLARGARNFTGLAVVGDAGPELVSLHDQDVYSNSDSAAMLASNIGSDVSAQPIAAVAPSRPQQNNTTRDVTIVLEVNGKKFAKATIDDFGPEIAKEIRAVLR